MYDPRLPGRCAGMFLGIMNHVFPEGDHLQSVFEVYEKKCKLRIRESQGRSRAQELAGCRTPEALAEASQVSRTRSSTTAPLKLRRGELRLSTSTK